MFADYFAGHYIYRFDILGHMLKLTRVSIYLEESANPKGLLS